MLGNHLNDLSEVNRAGRGSDEEPERPCQCVKQVELLAAWGSNDRMGVICVPLDGHGPSLEFAASDAKHPSFAVRVTSQFRMAFVAFDSECLDGSQGLRCA